MRRLLALEAAQFLRSRTTLLALVCFLGAVAIGLWHGRTVIDRQRQAIADAPALQAEQHRAVFAHLPPTAVAGDQLYYLVFHTTHEPSPWAAFSVGMRDVQSFNLKIRLLAVQGQLYAADLANPMLASFGSFDAAFALVALAPLLLIALAHDTWSSERELGTWVLVRSQPVRGFRVILGKLLLRGGLVGLVVSLVVVGSALYLDLPFDWRVVQVLALVNAYVAAWIGVVALVASARWSSGVNMVALLGVWIAWVVLAPALLTLAAAARYPMPEALELTVRQRQGYHAAWDRPLPEVMQAFYAQYPEFASAAVPTTTYSNAWYYAMQQAGDDAAAPAAAAYFSALDRRRALTRRGAIVSPAAALQLALSDLARTDLDSHVAYLRSVASYHERLKRLFLPAIFDNRPVSAIDWAAVPAHRHHAESGTTGFPRDGFAVVLASLLTLTAGLVALRRSVR